MEPASKFEDLKIPIPSEAGEIEVDGVLGVPEWWPSGARVGVILGPGSTGRHDDPLLTELQRQLTERKLLTLKFNFPFGQAGKKRPDSPVILRQAYRAAIQLFTADATAAPAHVFVGGLGLGAKVASEVATGRMSVTGLYALGYPLHVSGKPEKLEAEQLYRIITPMLFLQGSKAKNCEVDVLRRVLGRVGAPTALHVVEEADHLLRVAKKSGRTAEDVVAECLAVMETWFQKVVGA